MSKHKDGVKITPEIVEELKKAKSVHEFAATAKAKGIGLGEPEAKTWFEKLHGTAHGKELHGCFEQHCPKCGSTDYVQRFIPDGPTSGAVYCHCNHCGYDKVFPG